MSMAFVAVIRADRIHPGRTGDLPGVTAVHSLTDLAQSTEPDAAPVVLLDPEPAGPAESAQVTAVLATLRTVEEPAGLVVTSVRPVTDTLKQVGAGGMLTGTADREHHRFVTAPIATRLGLLRTALAGHPQARTAGEILACLAGAGATVVATSA